MKISVQTGTVVYEYGFEKGYQLIRDAALRRLTGTLTICGMHSGTVTEI